MKTQKSEKITDKALNRSIILAVIGVLLCLAMLSATTWAWFGESVSSVGNRLGTGEYRISVTVTDSEGNAVASETDSGGKEFYRLSETGVYSITLRGEGSVSGGYGILECGGKRLYTEQIYTEKTEATPKQITFSFSAGSDAELYVSACWGCYNGTPDVTDGCEIILSDRTLETEGEQG